MSDDDGLVQEFLVESYENLDQLDRDFVELEQDPGNREILGGIFRTIHTIKGTSGFLAFEKLEKVTHVGENLLSRLRDGSLELNPEITSALLSMVDAVRQMLSSIEESGREGETDYSQLVDTLKQLNEGTSAEATNDDATVGEDTSPTPAQSAPEAEETEAASAPVEPAAPEAQPTPEPQTAGRPAETKPTTPSGGGASKGSIAESAIRVDVGLLDQLMNLVGELVLARNQILQHSASQSDSDTAFLATCQRLNQVTTELQEGVMKTRMQPIGSVWSKFPRVARDLATTCEKQIRVEMEGKETEVDKSILEAIKDPLTHIVRNSCDHGIETPAEREAAGKSPEGQLLLRAFHEGGQVNIEISDDGRGIDPEKIKSKCLEKGVITPEQATRMSDRELVYLIFAPGFSTAAKVTNVSGRGVGMDVVKTNIEKIGGTVDIQSVSGQGTTIRVKIPLTLAIVPALIVTTARERFAIPQVSLLELVRLEGSQARDGVEMIHGAPVYRLRGNLLPLVYLREQLRLEKGAPLAAPTSSDHGATDGPDPRDALDESTAAAPDDAVLNIVVLQADDRQFGLVVDEINDTEEIVVKPLGHQFKGLSAFSGATIMGDGTVALILDVLGIAASAGVVSETKDSRSRDVATTTADRVDEKQALLIFSLGGERKMAVPLSLVARLEEFPGDAVERAGDQTVVQYRGQIMPLITLSKVFGTADSSITDGKLQVIVYTLGDKSVGLVVGEILDVVEQQVQLERCSTINGLVGSAVLQDRVTDLVDVAGIVKARVPAFADAAGKEN